MGAENRTINGDGSEAFGAKSCRERITGKSVHSFPDTAKTVRLSGGTIVGKEEKLREQIRGDELYEKHYDPVEKELRKKAETTEKQQTKNERAKNWKKSGETGAKNSRKTGRKKGR